MAPMAYLALQGQKKIGQKTVQALNQVNKTHLYDFLQQKKVKYNIQMNYFQLIQLEITLYKLEGSGQNYSLGISLSNEITDLQNGFPVSLQQQLTGGFICN